MMKRIFSIVLLIWTVWACKEDVLTNDEHQTLKITSVDVLDCDFMSRATANTTYGDDVVGGMESSDEIFCSYYFYDPYVTYKTPKNTSFVNNGTTWEASTPVVRPNGTIDWNDLKIDFYYNIDPTTYFEHTVRVAGYYAKQETHNGYTKYYDMLYATSETDATAGKVTVTKQSAQCDVAVNFKHACALLKTADMNFKNMEGYRIDSVVVEVGLYSMSNVKEDSRYVCFSQAPSGDWVAIVPTKEAIGQVCKVESFTFMCTDGRTPMKNTITMDDPMPLSENCCYPFDVVIYRDLVEVNINNTIKPWTDEEIFGLYLADDGFFEIWTGEDMHQFATMVNSGRYRMNGRIMGEIIDISAYPHWQPIGPTAASPYQGVLDGNGKSLCGLRIDTVDANGQGLFGCLRNATIKDLRVYDSKVKVSGTANGRGMEVGILAGNILNSTISGCKAELTDTVFAYYNGGGLVGRAIGSTLEDCEHAGYVRGSYNGLDAGGIGGIVGQIEYATTMKNCTASGTAEQIGASGRVGGVVGRAVINCMIEGCKTTSTNLVIGKGTCSGGIAGLVYTTSSIQDCTVKGGKVQSSSGYVGGVVGLYQGNKELSGCKVYDCTLEQSASEDLGGVVGQMDCTGGIISDCEVRNCTFIGINKTGGVVGSSRKQNNTVKNCKVAQLKFTNNNVYAGGVVGWLPYGKVSGCHADSVIITGGSVNGGIIGHGSYNNTYSCEVEQCNVSAIRIATTMTDSRCGAVAGYLTYNSKMTGCTSTRSSIQGNQSVGAILGKGEFSATLSYCHSLADTVKVSDYYVGGVVGYLNSVASSCSYCSAKDNVVTGGRYAGGVVGYSNVAAILLCDAEKNKVTGSGGAWNSQGIGGIVGCQSGGSVDQCKVLQGELGGDYSLGGIVGWANGNAVVSKCTAENGVLEGTADNIGGVIGRLDATLTDCYCKKGEIRGKDKVGGVVGYYHDLGSRTCKNSSCEDSEIKGNSRVGGIFGSWECKSSPATNKADGMTGMELNVLGNNHVGGLVGYIQANTTVSADILNSKVNCKSIVAAAATNSRVGGLCGESSVNVRFENCEVEITDKIEGSQYVGGLAGQVNGGNLSSYYNCKVTGIGAGKITGKENVGGAFGQLLNGSVFYCSTNIPVEGTKTGISYIGGFCGSIWTASNVMACGSSGSVTSIGERVGGFAGHLNAIIQLVACHSTSNVTGTIDVGGLLGRMNNSNSTVLSCYASGSVTGTTTNVGSLIGSIQGGSPQITNCVTTGSTGAFGNGIGIKEAGAPAITGCLLSANNATTIADTLRYASIYCNTLSKYWYPDSFWGTVTDGSGLFPLYNTTFYTGDDAIR